MSEQIDGLFEKLTALIRSIYREPQADDIIRSFEAVFSAQEDDVERREALEYWLDFYRLQQRRLLKRRRRPLLNERTAPCAACGYPASHRHHLWDIATHGENEVTIQLCANCHELHHLMYNALVKESAYSRSIVRHVLASGHLPHAVIQRVLGWCLATIRYEAANGWVDGRKGSRAWVAQQLGWPPVVQAASRLDEER